MKIGTAPYPSMFPFRAMPKRAADGDAAGAKKEPADVKASVRETMLRRLSEMQAAQARQGMDNPRVKRLIDIFKSGRKLAPDEMAYLRAHAPGQIDWIERVAHERAALELGMRSARTKTDVQMTVLLAADRGTLRRNAEEHIVRVRHYLDAQAQYMKTAEYRNKPFSHLRA